MICTVLGAEGKQNGWGQPGLADLSFGQPAFSPAGSRADGGKGDFKEPCLQVLGAGLGDERTNVTGWAPHLSQVFPCTPPRDRCGAPGCLFCLALPKLPGPVTNSPEHLLSKQVIWKEELNAFKIKRNVILMAEGK